MSGPINASACVTLGHALDAHRKHEGHDAKCQVVAVDATKACRLIVDLSAGWDEHGSTGPKKPYRWETVARMAMDYARYALGDVLCCCGGLSDTCTGCPDCMKVCPPESAPRS